MIFLSDSVNYIYKSYSAEQIGSMPVVTMAEIRQNKAKFASTKIIFSSWGMPVLSKEEIQEYLPKVEALFFAAGSVKYFALPFLQLGIRVFSAWGGNAIPVAEFCAAQIVLANKGYFQVPNIYSTHGGDSATKYSETFPGNYNVKVGILGAGQIGRYLIGLLKPYKMEISVFDPYITEEMAQEVGVKKVDIETIFEQCQTISNHLANNADTRGILNYTLFKLMKKNATFINTGRGAQVVEDDLLRALKEEPARTALLDVSIAEYTEAGTPLLSAPNVYMTPHRAGSFANEVKRLGVMMMEVLELYLAGKTTNCEVTEDMLEKLA